MKTNTIQKHKAVIDTWLSNGENGVAAYTKHYPKSSYNSAKDSFSKILTKPYIESYIAGKRKEAAEASQISRDLVLRHLKTMLEVDVTDYMKMAKKRKSLDDGQEIEYEVLQLQDLEKLPKSIRQAIQSIEQTTTGIKLTFVNKRQVIETINKMLGYNHESEKGGDVVINDYSGKTTEDLLKRLDTVMKLRENDKG